MNKHPRPTAITPQHQDTMHQIGLKIKSIRMEKGMSYTAMAECVGISRNNYNLMELGKVYFKFSTLFHILEYHKIKVSDFFSDIE